MYCIFVILEKLKEKQISWRKHTRCPQRNAKSNKDKKLTSQSSFRASATRDRQRLVSPNSKLFKVKKTILVIRTLSTESIRNSNSNIETLFKSSINPVLTSCTKEARIFVSTMHGNICETHSLNSSYVSESKCHKSSIPDHTLNISFHLLCVSRFPRIFRNIWNFLRRNSPQNMRGKRRLCRLCTPWNLVRTSNTVFAVSLFRLGRIFFQQWIQSFMRYCLWNRLVHSSATYNCSRANRMKH